MKKILMITTGGTIASKSSSEGLSPQMDSAEILGFVPSVSELCQVETLALFNIDSTNVGPQHWILMATAIRERYEAYDGFVTLHGTDTMSYTAAALSYLLQNIAKPIVLTGAQRPIDQEVTDAKLNLTDSFRYAADDDSFGVCIVFDGQVIAGTRARKIRTKSFNAFSTIDYPNLAVIRNEKIVRYIRDAKPKTSPVFYDHMDKNLFVLKLTPGINPLVFSCLKQHYRALVIESFGVGGIPCSGNDDFLHAIDDWIHSGRLLVMTTQVPHEGSDMGIYEVGVRLKKHYDLLEAYDMTTEATVTKLMWVLANASGFDEMKRLFYTPVNYDIIG